MDLFLIHDPLQGKDVRLNMWSGLIKARDNGKLRSIGVSNLSASPLIPYPLHFSDPYIAVSIIWLKLSKQV